MTQKATPPGMAPAASGGCDAGLLPPPAAQAIVLAGLEAVAGTETVPLWTALGRVAAADCRSSVALPRFDNAAVDGYGLHAEDLQSGDLESGTPAPAGRSGGAPSPAVPPRLLPVAGRVAAGAAASGPLLPGTAIRILTGAHIPDGVAAVVAEERTSRLGEAVRVAAPPPPGANIRRRGEDVAPGTVVVGRGATLDARHLAIAAAAGLSRIAVRRRLRIGVLSTGDELADVGGMPGEAGIVDTNRPMLLGLLSGPAVEAVDLGILADQPDAIAAALAGAAGHLDLLVTSGGVAGSDADHLERAILAAGGACRTLKLALRPGKPIATGRIGAMRILALPGNPVAALVNFLLFGRPMIRRLLGTTDTASAGVPARVAVTFRHKPGRTEFVPVKIVDRDADGTPRLDKLGRGGSARLMPLVAADGLAEIAAEAADLPPGAGVSFFPFAAAFAL